MVEENKQKLDRTLKLVYAFLLGYISLIPFYYFSSIQLSGMKIPLIKYTPLLLILFLFAGSILKGYFKFKDVIKEPLNIYIALYFFLTLLTGLGTDYYLISILKAVYYGLTGILMYFIIRSWKLSLEDKSWFLEKVATFAFIVSLYGILTLILGKDVLFGKLEYTKSNVLDPRMFLGMGRISSSLGNPHFLANFLSAIFPISIYLLLLKSKKTKTAVRIMSIISVGIFFGTLLTFSIGAFLGIIFFFILYQIKIKSLFGSAAVNKATRLSLFAGVILLCIILIMMATNILLSVYNRDYLFGKFFNRIDFQKLANKEGFIYRLNSVKFAFASLQTHALFGKGIGKIGAGDERIPWITMDNFYCLSIIENGLFTSVFMFFAFYLIIKKGLTKLKTAVSIEENNLSYFLVVSIAVFLVNMFFWDVFNHPTMRILFWSFVGFLL